jgi:hypothetical protein
MTRDRIDDFALPDDDPQSSQARLTAALEAMSVAAAEDMLSQLGKCRR